ncbi:helicase-related protein [Aeromonas caviae]
MDAVLATNMISVGVDVSRLGVMVVNGQPKNTAEYIQASSRVGRDTGKAGIVFTLYNWTRPRDRSHYEKFQTFHSAFYRHVESSSVTPFASRARDRALHSILIAMVRLTIPEFADNKSAIRIHEPALRQRVRALIGVICARVKETEAEEADDTRQNLEDILYDWMEKARMTSKLSWTGHHTDSNALLKNKVNGEDPWEMQRSVRDVEAQVKVSMMVQE